MSYSLVNRAMDTDTSPTERLVLIVLAEAANKEGICWPAVSTIERRSGLGERSVRRSIAALAKAGHITVRYRTGASTNYLIHPCQSGTPSKAATPATVAPLSERHPCHCGRNPCQCGPLTVRTTIGDIADAISPAHVEPDESAEEKLEPADAHVAAYHEWVASRPKPKPKAKGEPKPKADTGLPWHGVPEWMPLGAWHRFLKHRQDKHKQVTENSAILIIAKLDEFRAEGMAPADVLDQSVRNGWTGVFPLDPPSRRQANGNPPHHDDDEPSDEFARAVLERQADRAARQRG